MEHIGERIKSLREAKKMTQIRLSLEVDVSQETISGYETGRISPSTKMLIKLADSLDTSIDYLIGRTDIISPIDASRLLTEREDRLLHYFKLLSSQKQERLLGYIDALSDNDLIIKK